MKFVKFLAIAAAAVALAACGKDNKSTVDLKPAPYYDNSTQFIAPAGSDFEEFIFFADGTGLAKRQKPASAAVTSLKPRKNPAPQFEYKAFTYTVNGNKYTINGLYDSTASLEYDPQNHTITLKVIEKGVEKVVSTIADVQEVEVVENVAASALEDLCRAWKVSSVDIHVDGTAISGGQIFRTGDLYEIAKSIASSSAGADNKPVFDPEKTKGYNIASINFAKTGSFVVNFVQVAGSKDNKEPFVADWTLTGTSFSYDLKYGEGNDLFNAHASGTLTVGDGKCVLNLSVNIEGSSNYKGSIILTLIPA
ncbi:MAG: hypothetical protein J5771_04520 [Bacteroidales bacterium]|nr:hypothetical protein [Bacteroidales bacterium]